MAHTEMRVAPLAGGNEIRQTTSLIQAICNLNSPIIFAGALFSQNLMDLKTTRCFLFAVSLYSKCPQDTIDDRNNEIAREMNAKPNAFLCYLVWCDGFVQWN